MNPALVGAGIGALLTYFFDPSGGRERRAALRHRVARVKQRVQRGKEQGAGEAPISGKEDTPVQP